MRDTIFGVYTEFDWAKAAVGRIKKEAWARAEVAVLYSGAARSDEGVAMELGAEFF